MNRVILQGPDVGQQMEYMLATGNLRSKTGLGFQQVNKHNLRCTERGQYIIS